MATSLVHIGDFHAKPDARNIDRYRALDQIVNEAMALPALGAWLWPGDLNDGPMSIDDRNALAARLQRMADRAPVVICYGNHDRPGDLDVFTRLKARFPIYVLALPTTLCLTLATGETCTIFVLPYPTKAGLVAAGFAKDAVLDAAADLLEPIFMTAAADLDAAAAKGHLTLMIGHVNVAGSRTSVGQPNIGHEIELSPRHLDRLGDVPKLLNHIHVAQGIAGAKYAGSVCRLNWGEIEPKGYTVLDYAGSGDWITAFRPLAVAPMYHVEGTLTREGFIWAPTDGPGRAAVDAPASWDGCDVRVRVRFNQSERSVLDMAVVRAPFAAARRLEVEPIAVIDRVLRAPAIATAVTLVDKLAAYYQRGLTEGELVKLAELQHRDPAQIVALVQAALARVPADQREAVPA